MRKEYENNDIGKSGTEIKSNSTSITAYSSTYQSHSFFIDGLVGYGRISNSLIRIEEANTSNSLTGKRDINQFFGSIKFNKLTNKNKFTYIIVPPLLALFSISIFTFISIYFFENKDSQNKNISKISNNPNIVIKI